MVDEITYERGLDHLNKKDKSIYFEIAYNQWMDSIVIRMNDQVTPFKKEILIIKDRYDNMEKMELLGRLLDFLDGISCSNDSNKLIKRQSAGDYGHVF